MKKTFTVTLGQKEYIIEKLTRVESKQLRYDFAEQVEAANVQDGSVSVTGNLRLMDAAYDLLFGYSPLLAADAERIEEEATQEELTKAIQLIQVQLFGPLLKTPNANLDTTKTA